MYDIIGDIHGHADELVELLEKLGYRESLGCYRHDTRQAVFCGDFVDRGPAIPDVVRIVRHMVEQDAALAVMGNHEFNALAFHTPHPDRDGEYLRPHSERNLTQHAETLRQFDDVELHEALKWFRTLPPSLDLREFRVVHACWDDVQIAAVNQALEMYGGFSPQFLLHATAVTDPVFEAVECVMKGPELRLPDGLSVTDKEGNIRKRIRIRWFEPPSRHTWATYSLPIKPHLPDEPVPDNAPAAPYDQSAPPVFVGHYWLPDAQPAPLAPNVVCLDYSVARQGLLCAYRFDGEAVLSADKFVSVPGRTTGAVV